MVNHLKCCKSWVRLGCISAVLLVVVAVFAGCSTSSNHGAAVTTTTVGAVLMCPNASRGGIGVDLPSGVQGGSTPADALSVFVSFSAAAGVELPSDVVGSVVQSGDRFVGVFSSNGTVVAEVDLRETDAGWFVVGVEACR
jgi:hypothetical protein